MKYKVGDKVKIREDLVVGYDYNDYTFIVDMEKYKGAIATIKYCYSDESYEVDIDGGTWYWTDDMLEDAIKSVVTPDTVHTTVDVGFYLDYCGHGVLKDVWQCDIASHGHVFFNTKDDKNQYILPTDAIDFIIPHEVD